MSSWGQFVRPNGTPRTILGMNLTDFELVVPSRFVLFLTSRVAFPVLTTGAS